MLVSSSNKTYLNLLEIFIKSFMYKLNRTGFKTDHCGTPKVICSLEDTVVPRDTNGERLER